MPIPKLPANHPAITALNDALYNAGRDEDDAANFLEEAEAAADNLRAQLTDVEKLIDMRRAVLHDITDKRTKLTNALLLLGQ